jgi:hypothetical protein
MSIPAARVSAGLLLALLAPLASAAEECRIEYVVVESPSDAPDKAITLSLNAGEHRPLPTTRILYVRNVGRHDVRVTSAARSFELAHGQRDPAARGYADGERPTAVTCLTSTTTTIALRASTR